ncbi:MAG: hypothetical protein PVG60_09330, partial [Desulfarculaceae bacterium]
MLGPGKALLDYGPVCLSVEAWRAEEPAGQAAQAGALEAAAALDRLVPWLETARLPVPHPDCQEDDEQPQVLRL